MIEISNWITEMTGISSSIQQKIFSSLMVILVIWLIRFLVFKLVAQIKDAKVRYNTRNILSYVIYILAFLIISRIWFEGIGSLATYFGLLSAGLAIALKDPLTNFAGFIFLIFRRPFQVGDRIEIGDHKGDVIDIRIFQFSINEIGNWVDGDQSTGRIIHIPNANVFLSPIANYHRGFSYIWNEIPVLVTFESDWEKALEILDKVAAEYDPKVSSNAEKKLRGNETKSFLLHYSNLKHKVYVDVKDSGVMLTIRHLCTPHKRRDAREFIWKRILKEFAKYKNIDFAYPTVRRYDNRIEGKEALGDIGDE